MKRDSQTALLTFNTLNRRYLIKSKCLYELLKYLLLSFVTYTFYLLLNYAQDACPIKTLVFNQTNLQLSNVEGLFLAIKTYFNNN